MKVYDEMSSGLQYLSIDQLKLERQKCKEYIAKLNSQLAGQENRLEWIEKYIFQRTPVEMSIGEIEQKLGHKIIITK